MDFPESCDGVSTVFNNGKKLSIVMKDVLATVLQQIEGCLKAASLKENGHNCTNKCFNLFSELERFCQCCLTNVDDL